MNQNGFKLIHYTEWDGIRNFSDSYIKQLFDRMEAEGLAEKVFYDGSTKTSDEFLNGMKYGQCKLFLIFQDSEITGLTWLTGFQARSAVVHFCLFRKFHGQKAIIIGEKVRDELLYMKDSEGYIFDVLIGMTPSNNIPALQFMKSIGGTVSGEIPKAIWDAGLQESVSGVMIYFLREDK